MHNTCTPTSKVKVTLRGQSRDFFQDFGNITHTHATENFSDILLKLGKNV
jgi:hypothetical protein